MRILAIDGGGIRGIYPAYILQRMEEEFGIKYSEHFDLIVGTSTGSIIAAALATDYPIADVVKLYEKRGKQIFKRKLFGWGGLFASRYSSKSLYNELVRVFAELTLSDTKTKLVIPTTDIGNGCVHVIKSNYDSNFIRDPKRKITDTVLASCSAPTYFAPHISNNYLLADGGLWANNPSLVALTEAITRLGVNKDDISLLSLGTGIGEQFYAHHVNPWLPWNWSWGFASRWRGSKLIDTIMNLQVKSSENTVGLILGSEQYLRINFSSEKTLSLSDSNSVQGLKSKADTDFTMHSEKIRQFLGLGGLR